MGRGADFAEGRLSRFWPRIMARGLRLASPSAAAVARRRLAAGTALVAAGLVLGVGILTSAAGADARNAQAPVVALAQDGKPCYANPEVVKKGIERALKYFEANPQAGMISVSAPDGLGFGADKAEVDYTLSFVSQEAFEKRWEGFAAEKIASGKTEQGRLRATAGQQPGYYQIRWENGTVKSVNQPAVMLGQRKQFTCNNADLYFYVPHGTGRFIIKSQARNGPLLKVCDAKGNEVLNLKRGLESGPDVLAQCVVDVPQGSDGAVWSVSGPDDAIGWGSIELIGVPNYLSFLPDQLLVPREALEQP